MSYIIISLVLVSILSVIFLTIFSRKELNKKMEIPDWAKKAPLRISYNKYKYEGNLQNDKNLPSGRLLFESINKR